MSPLRFKNQESVGFYEFQAATLQRGYLVLDAAAALNFSVFRLLPCVFAGKVESLRILNLYQFVNKFTKNNSSTCVTHQLNN